ncbi:MAG: toprim domain-containing protein [Planctomycetales bacterium]
MPRESSRYIPVDELLPQVSLEQAAAYFHAPLPELKRIGDEIRTRCFLNCGREQETGNRALAINVASPAKQWRCHQYGCGKGGNLVSLCDYLKPGPHMDGRPRGERFKEIARDLQAMVHGTPPPAPSVSAPAAAPHKQPAAVTEVEKANVPLSRSENERARGLVHLDAKFVIDPAEMSPPAAAYFRRRPFLSSEACLKWRCGYLPRDSGGDRAGGTMRGSVVYPLLSERGEVLTWFGRDPQFEAKHGEWLTQGRTGREPEKFHFVKGFQRGLELFGQQASRLDEPGYRETIRETGILVVEGPNDVIALDALGVPAVGLCSNTISKAQVQKLARWAQQLSGGTVTLLLDCDAAGENGAKQALIELAPHCRVRLGWSPALYGGRFRGRQPESLTAEEWTALRAEW